MNAEQINPTMGMPAGAPQRGFVRGRLHNFGLTMVIMGASFFLYYLGLFGTVAGPLNPGTMGETLAGLGVTQRHIIIVLVSALIGAASWNWVFNLTSYIAGNRMTCKARQKDADDICGAPVKRLRHVSKRGGQTVMTYACPCGHRRPDAHFRPVTKGTVSNTVLMACLVFVTIAIFGI